MTDPILLNNQSHDTSANHTKFLTSVAIVGLVMIVSTGIAGYITRNVANLRLKDFFDRQADSISNTYYSNLYTHITVLEGFRGLWNVEGSYDHESFTTFINSLSLDSTYEAGISSFFFIKPVSPSGITSFENKIKNEPNLPEPYNTFNIHPESNKDTLYPVTYVEPVKGRESTVGLDFSTFPDRLAGIEYARDNNALATTQSLTFVSTSKPGFFFFLPLYKPGLSLERTQERRDAFEGVVGAAFLSESAFEQIFGGDDPYPHLDFQIYQGEATTEDRLLHDHDSSYTAHNPDFEATRIIRLQDQTWTIKIQSKPSLALGNSESRLPILVFFFGLIATALVVGGALIAFIRHLKTHSTN